MEFKIDIREFLRQFNREYEFLYKHNDMVAGYNGNRAVRIAQNVYAMWANNIFRE